MDDIWLITEAIGWTETQLACCQIEVARLDAEVLLCHTLGVNRAGLYANSNQPLGSEDKSRYRELIRRRRRHEPVAYLTGEREFWSMGFQVTPQALIPRPETERLVEIATALLESEQNQNAVVIDIGAGCGNIILALARELPRLKCFASDISPDVIELASQNAKRHGLANKIKFLAGDLLDPYHKLDLEGKADLIVSNLPYIPTEDIGGLPPDVRGYEPRLALDGGAGGLEIISRLIEQSVCFLRPGGYLILEIGSEQAEKVRSKFKAEEGWDKPRLYSDYNGLPRVIAGKKLN